jgi:protein-disulfide isomerase
VRPLLATALTLLWLTAGPASAQPLRFTEHPAMVRGPARAPVTIVEFSDYQ